MLLLVLFSHLLVQSQSNSAVQCLSSQRRVYASIEPLDAVAVIYFLYDFHHIRRLFYAFFRQIFRFYLNAHFYHVYWLDYTGRSAAGCSAFDKGKYGVEKPSLFLGLLWLTHYY
jgi:hypothetical protein